MATKEFDALEIGVAIEGTLIEDLQKAALRILQTVVVGTPVGDPTLWQSQSKPPGYVGGHARRNWIVSTRSPVDTVTGTPGRAKGKGAATNTALSKGKRKINAIKADVGSIIIQNNVPYIVPLNNGHSTQAPANFVQTAIMAGLNAGRNDRKELP